MRTTTLGIAVAGTCAATLAFAVAASAVSTSVAVVDRFGPTQIDLDPTAGPATITDDFDADTFQVPALSATAQLRAAATARRARLGFDVFGFGSFVSRVGPSLPSGQAYRLTRNHRSAAVGADALLLAEGDYVQWAPLRFAAFSRPELSLRLSSDAVPAGSPFTVQVLRHNVASGAAVPAPGATVRYRRTTATTNRRGTVRFVAGRAGAARVHASAKGAVETPSHAVCTFAGDPRPCGVDAPAGSVDNVAPGSEIRAPRAGGAVRSLRGSAGPDRSDIARVEVALARQTGGRCRFLNEDARFTGPRRCSARVFVDARRTGGNWTLGLPSALAAGAYRVWSRATDGAGNRENSSIRGVNSVRFNVS